MTYYFDYGLQKDGNWLEGIHKEESYTDGKRAFARFIEIQRNGKRIEKDLADKNLLPKGNKFLCVLDIEHNGESNLSAAIAFAKDAFDILKNEQSIIISNNEN